MPDTITSYATDQLARYLDELDLCDGINLKWGKEGGWASGDVSICERKGKLYPVYSLEVELPFSGAASGTLRLPDLSIEMLDELEVEIADEEQLPPAVAAALRSTGTAAVVAAVRSWASDLRRQVSEDAAHPIPRDPPTQTQQPRAAALISEEEAMSAGGAAALEDAQENDIEDIPRADEGEDEAPFTEEEVTQLFEQVVEIIRESFAEEEAEGQLAELEKELEGKDVQEQGKVLIEVLEYFEQAEQEGEGGGEEAEGEGPEVPPFESEAALEALWKEVVEMCNEEDVPSLEGEIKDKSAEEQWKILHEVRDYLVNGDPQEQEAFNQWEPSLDDLEEEWEQLLERVPEEEKAEVQEDFVSAQFDDKKRLVWDVRKFIAEQDAQEEEEEEGAPPPQGPPPPRGGRGGSVDDAPGKSEVRRRGARRGPEYEMNYEYDFQQDKDGGDWDELYDKESKRGGRGGRSVMLFVGVAVLLMLLALLLTATVLADDDEPVLQSALRLVRLS